MADGNDERSVGLPATADSGIYIPRDVADAEGLPEDLDANIVGPYRFPNPRRRRIAGWMYLATAGALALLAGGNGAFWLAVVLLGVVAAWHFVSAWPLGIEQEEALERAAGSVPFAVGHASAAITLAEASANPLML